MKKVRLLVISIIMIALIISAFKICERGKLQSQNEIVKKENKKLIMDNIGIDDDCAQGIVDELNHLKIKKLISIQDYTKEKKGYTFSVTDEEKQVYYIGLGALGYLEIIRKDSLDGEILYGAVE